MPKAYAFLANGTEETELLCVVDILRRAGIETTLVSVEGKTVTSSHGVKIIADATIESRPLDDADLLFVPGGMPGTETLAANKTLISAIAAQTEKGKRVAAICAAPALVLAVNGFLDGKNATCFPTFADRMKNCVHKPTARVVTDGNITTARGMGCSVDLGLELVKLLKGEQAAEEVKSKIQY